MKKNSLPRPIAILVLTLLTAVIWVGMSVYRAVVVKPSASVAENISKPLNPRLDTDTIQKIDSAIFVQDSEVPQVLTGSPTPTLPVQTLETTPTTSPSATPVTQI